MVGWECCEHEDGNMPRSINREAREHNALLLPFFICLWQGVSEHAQRAAAVPSSSTDMQREERRIK